MIGEVERPNKNIRYKLIKINAEYYILDQDRPIWLILFPFVYWFKSHIVYQINETIYERLKHAEEKKSGKWVMILPVAFISPFLGRLLASIAERYDYLIPSVLSIILVVVFIVITLGVRIYVHQACYKKTDKMTGGLEILPKRKVKIRPKKISNYLVAFLGYLLFLCFAFMGMDMTMTYNNPMISIVLITSLFMFLIMNTIVINIGEVKMKYLDNDHDENSII